MTLSRLVVLGLVGAFACGGSRAGVAQTTSDAVREPAVAGRFYPASGDKLERAVHALLDSAAEARTQDPIAIVAPHAGYVFSGQVAADAYKQVAGRDYDVVVILGANHTQAGFNAIAVYPGRGFRTPLGVASVDQDVARAVVKADVLARLDATPHVDEHSIEVQVPFVQVLFPSARVVPIIVGTDDPETASRFGRALGRTLSGRRALVVASSDLSHYPDAATASRVDAETLNAIATLDVHTAHRVAGDVVARRLPQVATAACGLAPVMAAMAAAKVLGASRGVVVSYANSSQVAVGEPDRVVGYGAVVFARDPAPGKSGAREPSPERRPANGRLTAAQGAALVALARDTISRFLDSGTLPLGRSLDIQIPGAGRGAFVTLRKGGELRGCIGRIVSDEPLPQLVSRVAFEAAFRDPRFPPLSAGELGGVDVEVSVLSPPRRIPSPESVVVGRHGVVLHKGGRSAVFLPSVATEQGWDRVALLDNLCGKAGLAGRCWTVGAELEVFEAEVFGGASHR